MRTHSLDAGATAAPGPRRIYEDAAYRADTLDGCFWPSTCDDAAGCDPLSGALEADYAVIGAGYTGLSAALRLAQAGANVVVLDMHRPGWGASGRNGGFCCIGGAEASGDQIRARWGEDDLRRFRAAEKGAIELVEDRIATLGLNVDRHSEGEIRLAHSRRAFAMMQAEAAEARADFGVAAETVGPADLAAMGMGGRGFHGGLITRLGFALNPRKYAIGLAQAAMAEGARICADSPVACLSFANGRHVLRTPGGEVRAKTLILATNGYSADDLPPWMAGRYLPLQSSVIVTRPLTDAEIAAQGWSSDMMAYDSRHLVHYFRLMPDRRFLFGMRGAIRWTKEGQIAYREEARRHFARLFPAWAGVETPWFWSGLVCLMRDMVPFTGAIPGMENAFAAFGYHGNGVALASWSGDRVARLAMGEATDLPAFCGREPRTFELGRLRRWQLPLAFAWFRIEDAR